LIHGRLIKIVITNKTGKRVKTLYDIRKNCTIFFRSLILPESNVP
jgi:hypothetical protein